MLSEGVVEAPMDIDLAMITGAGFQFWNGGIMPLLDREGVTERVLGRRLLPPAWRASRPDAARRVDRRTGAATHVRGRRRGGRSPAVA